MDAKIAAIRHPIQEAALVARRREDQTREDKALAALFDREDPEGLPRAIHRPSLPSASTSSPPSPTPPRARPTPPVPAKRKATAVSVVTMGPNSDRHILSNRNKMVDQMVAACTFCHRQKHTSQDCFMMKKLSRDLFNDKTGRPNRGPNRSDEDDDDDDEYSFQGLIDSLPDFQDYRPEEDRDRDGAEPVLNRQLVE